MTRSLGDSPFHKGDAVSCVPEVSRWPLTPESQFVVVASDGIWDHLDDDAAVRIVGEVLASRAESTSREQVASDACNALIESALAKAASAPSLEDSADASPPKVDDMSVSILVIQELRDRTSPSS